MNTQRQQKKVASWSGGFVVGILVLAALIAVCWYYLRGRKTHRETPQQQSQLAAPPIICLKASNLVNRTEKFRLLAPSRRKIGLAVTRASDRQTCPPAARSLQHGSS